MSIVNLYRVKELGKINFIIFGSLRECQQLDLAWYCKPCCKLTQYLSLGAFYQDVLGLRRKAGYRGDPAETHTGSRISYSPENLFLLV